MRRVRQARRVRRVAGVPRRQIGVHGQQDGAVVFGHWRDGVAVVGVRQVFLSVPVRLQDEGLAIAQATPVTAPAHAQLTTAAAPTEVKGRAG